MRTFKVLGGGSLAGQVFYGEIASDAECKATDDRILLGLDTGALVTVDPENGSFMTSELQSDYLLVDPDDLPFLQHAWREARGERNALAKLTDEEIGRVACLYAYGPITRRPIDDELTRKGWVQDYDIGVEVQAEVDGGNFSDRAVEPSLAAYGVKSTRDTARAVLYQPNGCVHPYWRVS